MKPIEYSQVIEIEKPFKSLHRVSCGEVKKDSFRCGFAFMEVGLV